MSYGIRQQNRFGLLVFFLSFIIYLFTLCPAVYTGDSGELIAAAYTLGVPHAPGYPLYCILGKLFTFLPFGSIAYRVNLLSAFFASLSCVVVYLIVARIIKIIRPESSLTNRLIPASAAAIIFGFSDTFWSQAVVAEVYTLYVFFIGLCLLVLIKWAKDKKNSLLYWFSFLYGVSITCHQLGLFFAPGFFLLILLYQPRILIRPKTLFIMLGLFMLGLCFYLYIPIRALSDPGLNWNRIRDLEGFIGYLSRSQYGKVEENFSLGHMMNLRGLNPDRLKGLGNLLTAEFGLAWPALFAGFLPLLFKARRYLTVFLAIFILSGVNIWLEIGNNPKDIYVFRVYLLASYIIAAIIMGLGIFYIVDLARRNTRMPFYYCLLMGFCVFAFAPFLSNYSRNDQSRNYIAYDFGRNILNSLEKDAVFLGEGDNVLFILAYLNICEKIRTDVSIYDDIGGDVFKGTPFSVLDLDRRKRGELVAALLARDRRALYVNLGNSILFSLDKYKKEQVGIVYRILREDEEFDPGSSKRCWQNYQTRDVFTGWLENKDYLNRELIAGYYVALGGEVIRSNQLQGVELYRRAAKLTQNNRFIQQTLVMSYGLQGMHEESILISKTILEAEPADIEARYNLGVTYALAARYEEAVAVWNEVLRQDPDFAAAKRYIEKAQRFLTQGEERATDKIIDKVNLL